MSIINKAALRKAMSILLTDVPTILAALKAMPQSILVGKPRVSLRTPVPIFPEILSEPELGRRQTVTVVAGRFPSPDIMPHEESLRLTCVILPS